MVQDIDYKGHSGCRFKVGPGGTLIKYATGCPDRMDQLAVSWVKSKIALEYGCLRPFQVVGCVDFLVGESFEFHMEHIVGGVPILGSSEAREALFDAARSYFCPSRWQYARGFRRVCTERLATIPDGDLKSEVLEMLASSPDTYPKGGCHGDFGINNFLFKDGVVYTYDLSHSFIDSVLRDLATYRLSIIESDSSFAGDVLRMIESKWHAHAMQADIVRKIRVLEFYKETNSDSTKILHKKMFYDR